MAVVTFSDTVTVEVPHEPGNHFELRSLSGRELDNARDAFLQRLTDRLPPEHMKSLQTPPGEERPPEPGKDGDPLAGFDRTSLLRGVVSWKGPLYDKGPCNRDNRQELDHPTAIWAATEIVKLSKFGEEEKGSAGAGSEASATEARPSESSPGSGSFSEPESS